VEAGVNVAGRPYLSRRVSAPRGDSLVQIQRTVPAGQYTDGYATPGGRPFAIAHGDRAILTQYTQAIDAARRSIYIENQAFEHPEIVA
jgi:cardiolipin synthase